MAKKVVYTLLLIATLFITLFPGCKTAPEEVNNALPYIPPAYYNCIQATAAEVAFSYWSPYSMRLKNEGSPIPGEAYRDLVFVIKNYPITEWSLAELDKGYIRVDMIKCYPLNKADFAKIKPIFWADVVGINKGPESENYTDFSEGTLVFKDCVVLPAGAVKIPAEENEGIPVYPSY
jgi:hypothetical protein